MSAITNGSPPFAAFADTHVVLSHIYADPRLSTTGLACIENAAGNGYAIGVSAISLAEVLYLVETRRIPETAFQDFVESLDRPIPVLILIDVTRDILATMQTISREVVRDLPDRIVAATAAHFGVPLITADLQIQASPVQTIW